MNVQELEPHPPRRIDDHFTRLRPLGVIGNDDAIANLFGALLFGDGAQCIDDVRTFVGANADVDGGRDNAHSGARPKGNGVDTGQGPRAPEQLNLPGWPSHERFGLPAPIGILLRPGFPRREIEQFGNFLEG